MKHTITLLPDNLQFLATEGNTLLEEALAANLEFPFGCRNGACGSCKSKVIKGEFDLGDIQPGTLSEDEIANGYALACCAKPLSDMVINVMQATRLDLPIKKMPTRVEKIQNLADDVVQLFLKLPANDRFEYRAGQYINVELSSGLTRAYSLASVSGQEYIELHIRLTAGGLFSQHITEQMRERDILRIEGPLGTFHLRDSQKPAILLVGSTGFAPIKAIIEESLQRGDHRQFLLYWGAANLNGLYLNQLAEKWQKIYPHIKYIPVLSDVKAEDKWQGRSGLVHNAVLQDISDLSGYQVYACGGSKMIEAAHQDFCKQHLLEEEFFSDAFTPAASTQP